jgi:hypothetical protein
MKPRSPNATNHLLVRCKGIEKEAKYATKKDKEKILFTTSPSALEIIIFVRNHVLDSFNHEVNIIHCK